MSGRHFVASHPRPQEARCLDCTAEWAGDGAFSAGNAHCQNAEHEVEIITRKRLVVDDDGIERRRAEKKAEAAERRRENGGG